MRPAAVTMTASLPHCAGASGNNRAKCGPIGIRAPATIPAGTRDAGGLKQSAQLGPGPLSAGVRGSVRGLGRRRRRPQSLLSTLGKAVIASRNSQHLPLRFGIVQFAGTGARLAGAVAPVLGIFG